MSKISELHVALSEQAAELGFETIEEAEKHGYAVDYETGKLEDGRDLAHQEWLAKRQSVLADLWALYRFHRDRRETLETATIKRAIDFIEEGEY